MIPGKGKYRNALTVVFIAIMLFNYANATLFWHCHRIGSMEVVHSHIHGSAHTAGNGSGGHTTGQLQIIDVICHALYIADAVSEIHLERLDVLYGVMLAPDCLQEEHDFTESISLRGPPSLV